MMCLAALRDRRPRLCRTCGSSAAGRPARRARKLCCVWREVSRLPRPSGQPQKQQKQQKQRSC